jgi:hypothetical protein
VAFLFSWNIHIDFSHISVANPNKDMLQRKLTEALSGSIFIRRIIAARRAESFSMTASRME